MSARSGSVWPVALAGLGVAGVGLYALHRAGRDHRPATPAAPATDGAGKAEAAPPPLALPPEVAAVLPWPLSRFGGAAPASVPPVRVVPPAPIDPAPPAPPAPSAPPAPAVATELPVELPPAAPAPAGRPAAVGAAPAAMPAATAPDRWAGWVWPLPSWQGYAPRVSDGFGSPRDNGTRRHLGADVMYRRRTAGDQAATFPPRRPYSRWHFVPPGTPAMAMGPGVVVRAERTPRGGTVLVRHASPNVVTYYTHLGELFVRVGQVVRAGQAIGVVSSDPSGPEIDHLHVEIWPGGDRKRAIDPEPILRRLPVVGAPSGVPSSSVPMTGPAALAYLEAIVTGLGRGIPAEYLLALAKAESGPTLDAARGVLQITDTALADYNRRNPSTPVTADRLRDPVVAVRVAVDTLLAIIASYREHHGQVVGMREDWRDRTFVELLTAGWNAGHSQTAGVGRVVRYLRSASRPITLEAVWQFARDAGATIHLQNPAKLRFARAVAADYFARLTGGSAS
ncbi:MAG: M23 family metallopeptidase [Kofleriaceae bacterium]|nr:M23 family metallopeptidase [Kofleriaceae bacterium]MBP9168003.1 M23 family metallopeptidase [Kofleriaceae bacterium]MBP9856837.1 M23 family metallopeptidase [Kofleriaceae bacterium]